MQCCESAMIYCESGYDFYEFWIKEKSSGSNWIRIRDLFLSICGNWKNRH